MYLHLETVEEAFFRGGEVQLLTSSYRLGTFSLVTIDLSECLITKLSTTISDQYRGKATYQLIAIYSIIEKANGKFYGEFCIGHGSD